MCSGADFTPKKVKLDSSPLADAASIFRIVIRPEDLAGTHVARLFQVDEQPVTIEPRLPVGHNHETIGVASPSLGILELCAADEVERVAPAI
jgi:hypothetical protein